MTIIEFTCFERVFRILECEKVSYTINKFTISKESEETCERVNKKQVKSGILIVAKKFFVRVRIVVLTNSSIGVKRVLSRLLVVF